MQGIWIVVAIIWFVARAVISKGTTNQKKTAQTNGVGKMIREAVEASAKAGGAPTSTARPAAPTVTQTAVPDGRPSAAAPVEWAQPRQEISYSEGESRIDDEGCIGGSMEHGHEEGAPGQTVVRSAARDADTGMSGTRPRMTAAQMRQAVIASEVLRAPLAMRGRRKGFAR